MLTSRRFTTVFEGYSLNNNNYTLYSMHFNNVAVTSLLAETTGLAVLQLHVNRNGVLDFIEGYRQKTWSLVLVQGQSKR